MASRQNPNPNPEKLPQMKQEEEYRNWAELHRDILMVIFGKVGTIGLFTSAGPVCRPWRKVTKDEPDLWKRVDITNHDYGMKGQAQRLRTPTRLAIDRSRGKLEEFSIESFGDDDLLQYLRDRTSVLKRFRLIHIQNFSEEAIVKTIKKQPLLEELELTLVACSPELLELVGKDLPNLKIFKSNGFYSKYECIDDFKEEPFGIAKNMPQLRHLQLVGNILGNEGLKMILRGCPHLETLDIRRCNNVKMNSDMRARCARLKTLKLPADSLDEYRFPVDIIEYFRWVKYF